MRRALVLALLLSSWHAFAAPPRFFVLGTGRLAVESTHTGERVSVAYRRPDGAYDAAALQRLRHLFRSRDGREGDLSLRLLEVLSHVQELAGGATLRLVSGYRSPSYNQTLRDRGAKAASGSLHTEGLAADVAFPKPALQGLWLTVRGLDCCGAGYYASQGFLHVDVGRPRFWEATTSRVEENLSAANARLFARTEYDRYAPGEEMAIRLHALTAPPVRLAREARLVADGADPVALRVEGDLAERDGCLEVAANGARVRLRAPAAGGGRLVLPTCTPRVGETPESVETNRIEVR